VNEGVAGAEFLGVRLDVLTMVGLFLLLISGAFERLLAEVFPPAPLAKPSTLRLGMPRLVAMTDAEAAEAASLLGSAVADLLAKDWDIDEINQPYSLGAQRDRLDSYVASQDGWQIVARYEDRASGKNLGRPNLAGLRAAAALKEFDLLLVYRVDRLSRSIGQLGVLIEELDKDGVAFRSASEPFDTSTPAGRMMMQMLGVFAEFERASIVERIGIGMERKAKLGGWTVGTYPVSYRKLDGVIGPAVDPATAPIVREIFERYTQHRVGSTVAAF
jgi:DNA invertase Pin-like site-specific DNA recombinase